MSDLNLDAVEQRAAAAVKADAVSVSELGWLADRVPALVARVRELEAQRDAALVLTTKALGGYVTTGALLDALGGAS